MGWRADGGLWLVVRGGGLFLSKGTGVSTSHLMDICDGVKCGSVAHVTPYLEYHSSLISKGSALKFDFCRTQSFELLMPLQVTEDFDEQKIPSRGFGILDVGYLSKVNISVFRMWIFLTHLCVSTLLSIAQETGSVSFMLQHSQFVSSAMKMAVFRADDG
jgi:hypothetical protein